MVAGAHQAWSSCTTEKVDALKITTAAASLLPSEVEVVVELAKVVGSPISREPLCLSHPLFPWILRQLK